MTFTIAPSCFPFVIHLLSLCYPQNDTAYSSNVVHRPVTRVMGLDPRQQSFAMVPRGHEMRCQLYPEMPKLDGSFHGKSQTTMDDLGVPLILGNLHMHSQGICCKDVFLIIVEAMDVYVLLLCRGFLWFIWDDHWWHLTTTTRMTRMIAWAAIVGFTQCLSARPSNFGWLK